MQTFLTILGILAGAGAIFGFIEFLINRKDTLNNNFKSTNDKLDKIIDAQAKNERDICRTQLLLMMSDYPDCIDEIMKLAEHYFYDLHGNWYVSSIFRAFLKKNKIEEPIWLVSKKEDRP